MSEDSVLSGEEPAQSLRLCVLIQLLQFSKLQLLQAPTGYTLE